MCTTILSFIFIARNYIISKFALSLVDVNNFCVFVFPSLKFSPLHDIIVIRQQARTTCRDMLFKMNLKSKFNSTDNASE
jgi:hypothetical protein